MDQLDERQERYEDEVTAILMREYLREVGIEALELEKQLRQTNPVSKETERRMQRYIAKVFREKYRSQKREARHRVRGKMTFRRLAITACLIALLASTTMAGIPYIENAMQMVVMKQTNDSVNFHRESSEEYDDGSALQLSVGWVPKAYYADMEMNQFDVVSYLYTNRDDESKYFRVQKFHRDSTVSIDAENAEVKTIRLNDREVTYIRKIDENGDLNLNLAWLDEHQNYICVLAVNVEENDVLKIAEGVE